MASPHPKPTALKILRGERADHINQSEPKPSEADPTPPDYLDEVANQEWARMVPILTTMRVFTAADRAALRVPGTEFRKHDT